ncbi:carbohydrate kinase [bacterium]|nr:carbohydrate kinase [bacterium]
MKQNQQYKKFCEIIDKFAEIKVGVIGDMIADMFIFGQPYRLSREAPVVIVKHEYQKVVPGGAANTVNNILKLNGNVYPVGLVGDDDNGKKLLDYFMENGVDISGIPAITGRNTITKMRVMAGGSHTSKQQVVRIDYDPNMSINKELEQKIIKIIDALIEKLDGLIVSDYNYDLFTPAIIDYIKKISLTKMVIVDSHHRLAQFKGVSVITPNEQEAVRAVGFEHIDNPDFDRVGNKLMELVKPSMGMLITRGNKGMVFYIKDKKSVKIPISGSDDVTDVTGAGDTVVSVFTLSLLAGATCEEASRIANYAAGIVVMKSGTATTSRYELKDFILRCMDEQTS